MTTDVFSPTKRSEVMAAIRGRGNKSTEVAFAKAMRKAGITGWRRHISFRLHFNSRGTASHKRKITTRVIRPDFTFREQRLVIFVDGCFWHQCPIHSTKPKQNASFWAEKLAANAARDKATNKAFKKRGWRVMRVWEHELDSVDAVLRRLRRRLRRAEAKSL